MAHTVEVMSRDGKISVLQVSASDPEEVFGNAELASLVSKGPAFGNVVVGVRRDGRALVHVLSGDANAHGRGWKCINNNEVFDFVFREVGGKGESPTQDCASNAP